MKINVTKISFPEIDLTVRDSHKLRGFFGDLFKEESPLLHNHFENGETKYSYPFVQYKVINSIPYLLGINEGSDLLNRLFLKLKEIKIGVDLIPINDKKIELTEELIGINEIITKYKFTTLWMALNQFNFKKYISLFDDEEKTELLKKILIGNILSMYKYLGLRVDSEITVQLKLKEKTTAFKNQEMMGFDGFFNTNALIPEYFGLGKSVSRGFGTIELWKNADIY